MGIINRMLKQTAVYWGAPVDNGNGDLTYPDPVAVHCRWETVVGAVTNPRTHDVLYDSTVYVDRDVAVDGYLYLGSIEDAVVSHEPWPGYLWPEDFYAEGYWPELESKDPEDVPGAVRIKGFRKTPDLRNKEQLREATV